MLEAFVNTIVAARPPFDDCALGRPGTLPIQVSLSKSWEDGIEHACQGR